MTLRKYVSGLTAIDRKLFCEKADLPESYLSSLISDKPSKRKAGAKTIANMIAASDGVLDFESIRPDLIAAAKSRVNRVAKKGKMRRIINKRALEDRAVT